MRPLRALFYGSAVYHLSLCGRTPRELATRLQPAPGDAAAGARLIAETPAGTAPRWDDGAPERQAALHGFHWLGDLAAAGGAGATAAAAWTADWLGRYGAYDALAWRPDILGDRLYAWLAWSALAGADDARAFRAALARQARHLARGGGGETRGLMRLQALRGLVAASAALGGKRRLGRALRRFERETAAQIMPDGGHVARSPAAQLAALGYLIEARAALAETPAFLADAIERAAAMLRLFRHGDGRLALFNGAGEGDGAAIERALARAGTRASPPLLAPDLGFARLQAGGTAVILDCGRPAARDIDAAAHAGTLAFELSHERTRIVVNCGPHDGPGEDWTIAMRASAAHSTLVVADTNSSELGRDGRLGAGPQEVTRRSAEQDGNLFVAATHDGYRRNFGLVHGRQLFLAADGADLRGEDTLTGSAGRGFTIRFHLHPAIEATLLPEGNAVRLAPAEGAAWRLRAEGAVLSLGESLYRGAGKPEKTRQILLDGHVGTHGATVRWAIRRE